MIYQIVSRTYPIFSQQQVASTGPCIPGEIYGTPNRSRIYIQPFAHTHWYRNRVFPRDCMLSFTTGNGRSARNCSTTVPKKSSFTFTSSCSEEVG